MTKALMKLACISALICIYSAPACFAQSEYLTDGYVGIGASIMYLTPYSAQAGEANSVSAVSFGVSANARIDLGATISKVSGVTTKPRLRVGFHSAKQARRNTVGVALGFSVGGTPRVYVFSAYVYGRNLIAKNKRTIFVPFGGVLLLRDRLGFQSRFGYTLGVGFGVPTGENMYLTFTSQILKTVDAPLLIGVSVGLLFYGRSASYESR